MSNSLLLFISFITISFLSYSQVPTTEKEKQGYSIGYINAKNYIGEEIFTNKEVNVTEMNRGFKEGLNEEPLSEECNQILENPYKYTKDSVVYLDTILSSYCNGRKKAHDFYRDMKQYMLLDRMDVTFVGIGTEDFLLQKEAALDVNKMDQDLKNLKNELSATYGLEGKNRNKKIEEKANKWTKKTVYDNGVIISVVKRGWWWKHPSPNSEVTYNFVAYNNFYIQTGANSDSLTSPLSDLMGGLQFSVQKMYKKGKYKIFIPEELASGDGAVIYDFTLISFVNP